MSQAEDQHRPNANQQESISYNDVFSTIQEHASQQTESGNNKSSSTSNDESSTAPISASKSTNSDKKLITIGEALQATVLTAGKKKVDRSDAAAIQAAEVRATGRTNIMPGGLAATAQSAAQVNARTNKDEEKTTIADILSGAISKLPKDRPVTRQDAEGVLVAELRNNPNISTYPGGIAASMVAAARINHTQIDH